MGKKFYIADTHFDHENIIKLDGRPFNSVEEMNEAMIKNWNETVEAGDIVYILGDFSWKRNDDHLISLLDRLNGEKQLILGNHDNENMSLKLKKKFQDVKAYKEVMDDGRHVTLCHYPIPMYKRDYNEQNYMLYGHVHITIENKLMDTFREIINAYDDRTNGKHACQFYNVGVMLPYMDYTPRTLDEIKEGAEAMRVDG